MMTRPTTFMMAKSKNDETVSEIRTQVRIITDESNNDDWFTATIFKLSLFSTYKYT